MQLGVGRTLRARDHSRQEWFDQSHRNIIDTRLDEVSFRIGSIVSANYGILLLAIGQQQSGAVALHIPTSQHLHRWHRNIVHLDSVERHVTVDSATLQRRVHHCTTVARSLNAVTTNSFEQLAEWREVEIAQSQHHRVGHLLRRHAIEQQRLLIVAHQEVIDRDIAGIVDNLIGTDMPRLVALAHIRGFQVDRDSARPIVIAPKHRIDTQQSRHRLRGIVETSRQRHAIVLRSRLHRQIGHM